MTDSKCGEWLARILLCVRSFVPYTHSVTLDALRAHTKLRIFFIHSAAQIAYTSSYTYNSHTHTHVPIMTLRMHQTRYDDCADGLRLYAHT